MRASRLRWLIPTVLLVAVVLVPLAAWGQTPAPGEQPEVVRPWTWWLSIPIALAALGVALLIGLQYVRISSRFYAREEPPKIPERPRAYAGVNAPAYPAPAAEPEAEKPEPEAEKSEEGKPSEDKPSEAADSGDDVYERVLKEQLEKGVSPKVAEGRAKAAAHRARQSG